MKRANIFVLAFFCFGSVFAPAVFAEVYVQKDGLFWIDVPEGWVFNEADDRVSIAKQNSRDSILIEFQPYEKTILVVDMATMLEGARNRVIEGVALRGGKTLMKTERKIAGVPALHMGFLVPSQDGLLQMTAIVFFNKGYAFTATCDAVREFQRLEMEKIIDTLSFVEPKKPDVLGEEEAVPKIKKKALMKEEEILVKEEGAASPQPREDFFEEDDSEE